jgi:hypothetical protein
MKKAFLTVLSCLVAISVFAQNVDKKEVEQLASQANPNLSMARKATIEWAKVYDLQGDQVTEALKIQENKYRDLASIEGLKTTDKATYVQKRLSAIDVADGALAMILDDRQKQVFRNQQAAKMTKLVNLTAGLKKEGASEDVINDQLVNFDF